MKFEYRVHLHRARQRDKRELTQLFFSIVTALHKWESQWVIDWASKRLNEQVSEWRFRKKENKKWEGISEVWMEKDDTHEKTNLWKGYTERRMVLWERTQLLCPTDLHVYTGQADNYSWNKINNGYWDICKLSFKKL